VTRTTVARRIARQLAPETLIDIREAGTPERRGHAEWLRFRRSSPVPLPKRVAHFNRRVTNRVTRHLAWWLPGFAIVTHVGRRSGRRYRTPVNVFRGEGRYVFALTYGRDSDWVRNVVAAGTCEIDTRRKTVVLSNPELFTDPTRRYVPPAVRRVLGALHVDDFLAMTPASTEPPSRQQQPHPD
jgi:deazaflavin-dependent oxidoreductase (nitroreductase family)